MVIREVTFITVILSFLHLAICGSLKEVIGKDLKDTDTHCSRPAVASDERHGRYLRGGDLSVSGSDILGPGIDLNYGEYGQQRYGEQLGEGGYFGRQDAGHSGGEIGFFGTAARGGSAGHASQNAYLGDHRAAHADRQDAGYYGNGQGARRGFDQGGAVATAQGFNRKGSAGAAVGSRGGHRKGHHSSGFHNTYHKDESGNSTTFYDDAVDNGEHFFYDARNGAYDDRGANAYKGSFQDGAFQANARGNQGRYGVADGYDDARGHKGSYAHDEFYDDAHKYGQEKDGRGFYKNHHGGQQQNGGTYYGKAGEGYGHVVKNLGNTNKAVPYIPHSEVYNYGSKDYYPIGTGTYNYGGKDYYPINSYGSTGGRYYDKAGYDTVSAPVYTDDLKFGNGFATVVDSAHIHDGELDVRPKESGGYYGVYRGVAY